MTLGAGLAAAGVGQAAPAAGIPPRFALPIACAPGQDCAVQNYVDHDAGPAAADYTCGFLVYDGHKGTDIRLADLGALQRNVPVLAAAAGIVLRTRDGMADIDILDPAAVPVRNREAGNSVIIDHGDGWVTQYAHLKRGSVAVHPGDRVEAGQPIGTVGLSGNTEFPHLHFEVRHDGKTVDPFTGGEGDACGAAREPMWTPQTAAALEYRPTGLLAAGFAGEMPTADGVRAGDYDRIAAVERTAPVLVFWVSLYGTQKGDLQFMRILAPDGSVMVEQTKTLPDPKAAWIAWTGKKLKPAGWPPGTYVGEYRLMRRQPGGATRAVLQFSRDLVVR
jgi:murein DD-endopeptidase MepM/ murein hydrolase activator NlpD